MSAKPKDTDNTSNLTTSTFSVHINNAARTTWNSLGFNMHDKILQKRAELEEKRRAKQSIIINETIQTDSKKDVPTLNSISKDKTSVGSIFSSSPILSVRNSSGSFDRKRKASSDNQDVSQAKKLSVDSKSMPSSQDTNYSPSQSVSTPNKKSSSSSAFLNSSILDVMKNTHIQNPNLSETISSIDKKSPRSSNFLNSSIFDVEKKTSTQNSYSSITVSSNDNPMRKVSTFLNSSLSDVLKNDDSVACSDEHCINESLFDVCCTDQTSFYNKSSNFLSFIASEDTLFVKCEELEQLLDDEIKSFSVSKNDEITSHEQEEKKFYYRLKEFNNLEYNVKYLDLKENIARIAFMNSAFIMEISFGEYVGRGELNKTITDINLKPNVQNILRKDFKLRPNFVLRFTKEHMNLFLIIKHMVHSSFLEIKPQILQKYSHTINLDELISEFAQLFYRAECLLMELRVQYAFRNCKLVKRNQDTFEFAFEIPGVSRNMYLVLPVNTKLYPYGKMKPKFAIHETDRHRYSYVAFENALQRPNDTDEPFKCIKNMIKKAICFIKAMKALEAESREGLKNC